MIGSYRSFLEGGTPDWQIAFLSALKKWFGTERQKVFGGIVLDKKSDWSDQLANYPFQSIETHFVLEKRIWTTEMLIGYAYSLSYIDREKIKDRVDEFEQEIKDALFNINPENKFIEDHEISVIIARK